MVGDPVHDPANRLGDYAALLNDCWVHRDIIINWNSGPPAGIRRPLQQQETGIDAAQTVAIRDSLSNLAVIRNIQVEMLPGGYLKTSRIQKFYLNGIQ